MAWAPVPAPVPRSSSKLRERINKGYHWYPHLTAPLRLITITASQTEPRLSYACILATTSLCASPDRPLSSSLPAAGWEVLVQTKVLLFRVRELAK